MTFYRRKITRRQLFCGLPPLAVLIGAVKTAIAQPPQLHIKVVGNNVLVTGSGLPSDVSLRYSTNFGTNSSWTTVQTNGIPGAPGELNWTFPKSSSTKYQVAFASIKLGDLIYLAPVGKETTLLVAMETLRSSTLFNFESKPTSIGERVIEINGGKEVGGLRWIVYVNGSSYGATGGSQILHQGDVVEWLLLPPT